jgi:hypothetical protein
LRPEVLGHTRRYPGWRANRPRARGRNRRLPRRNVPCHGNVP